MQQPSFEVSVVMQRRQIVNRWQSDMWEPVAVVSEPNPANKPVCISGSNGVERWMFPTLPVALRREEAEGYYLNISTSTPRVFIMWGFEDELGVPQAVSASYNDACSWMDAGEQVDSVAMPPDMYDVVNAFAREHYRPEPKKRIRPRSFQARDNGPRSR